MCGIVSIRRLDGRDARKMTLHTYERQKGRGQQGFGYIALKDGQIVAFERSETEGEIRAKLKEHACDDLIFHHRMPTSTPNFEECAHPIKVVHPSFKYDWYVIHNGIIFEDGEWKEKHEKEGFKYSTEIERQYLTKHRTLTCTSIWNDSEAMAIELAKDLEKNGDGILVQGSVSFIALSVEKDGKKAIKKYWGTNSKAIVAMTIPQVFVSLHSEGKGDEMDNDTLGVYDYETKATTTRPYQIGTRYKKTGFAWHEEDPLDKVFEPKEKDRLAILCGEYDELQKELQNHTHDEITESNLRMSLAEVEDQIDELMNEEAAMKNTLLG